jgi:hypothetical protein
VHPELSRSGRVRAVIRRVDAIFDERRDAFRGLAPARGRGRMA